MTTLGRVIAIVAMSILVSPALTAAECTEDSFITAGPGYRLDAGWYETTPVNLVPWWEERGVVLDLAPVAWLAQRTFAAPNGTTLLILDVTPKAGEAYRSGTAAITEELVRSLAEVLGVTELIVQEGDAAGPCALAKVSTPHIDPFGVPASLAMCQLAAPPYTSLVGAVRGSVYASYATPTAMQLVQRMITTGIQTGCVTV